MVKIPEDTYEREVVMRLLEALLEAGEINKLTFMKIKNKYCRKEGECNEGEQSVIEGTGK